MDGKVPGTHGRLSVLFSLAHLLFPLGHMQVLGRLQFHVTVLLPPSQSRGLQGKQEVGLWGRVRNPGLI